jgi:hypothetical protein
MDYITITKDNGQKVIMEVVSIFNRSNSDYNYIIYKSNNDYYTAKYKGKDIVDLDTDLDEEEIKYANGIFRAIVGD